MQLRHTDAGGQGRLRPVGLGFGLFLCLATCVTVNAQPAVDAPPVPSEDVTTTKMVEIQNAITRFNNRDFEGAKQLLKTAREKNPKLPPVGVMLSQLFSAVRDRANAHNALEQAVRDDPGDPEAFVVFGENALRARRFTEAELLFIKAGEVTREFTGNAKRKQNLQVRSLAGRSAVSAAREDWQRAERLLSEVLAIQPTNTAIRTSLGRVWFKMGKEKEAYALFQEIYDTDNKAARPELNMAALYRQQMAGADNDERAVLAKRVEKLMGLAAERDKRGMRTQLTVAQWGMDQGNLEMAKNALQSATEIDSEAFEVAFLKGMYARYVNNLDAAEKAFAQAHQQKPSHPGALHHLIVVLAEQGDQQKLNRALENAKISLRTFPDRTQPAGRESLATLGWVLYKMGRPDDALQQATVAVRSGGLSADTAYLVAEILVDRGQKDQALQILRPILSRPTRFPNRNRAEALLAELGG